MVLTPILLAQILPLGPPHVWRLSGGPAFSGNLFVFSRLGRVFFSLTQNMSQDPQRRHCARPGCSKSRKYGHTVSRGLPAFVDKDKLQRFQAAHTDDPDISKRLPATVCDACFNKINANVWGDFLLKGTSRPLFIRPSFGPSSCSVRAMRLLDIFSRPRRRSGGVFAGCCSTVACIVERQHVATRLLCAPRLHSLQEKEQL